MFSRFATLILVLVSMALPGAARAESWCGLAEAVPMDTVETTYNTNHALHLERVFCSETNRSWKETRDIAANAGIPVGDLPIELGGTYRDQNDNAYQKKLCEEIRSSATNSSQHTQTIRTVNTRALEILSQCRLRPGLHCEITQLSPDMRTFARRAWFIPASENALYATVRTTWADAPANRLVCNPALAKGARIYTGGTTQTCEIIGAQMSQITMSLNTDGGPCDLSVAPQVSAPSRIQVSMRTESKAEGKFVYMTFQFKAGSDGMKCQDGTGGAGSVIKFSIPDSRGSDGWEYVSGMDKDKINNTTCIRGQAEYAFQVTRPYSSTFVFVTDEPGLAQITNAAGMPIQSFTVPGMNDIQ